MRVKPRDLDPRPPGEVEHEAMSIPEWHTEPAEPAIDLDVHGRPALRGAGNSIGQLLAVNRRDEAVVQELAHGGRQGAPHHQDRRPDACVPHCDRIDKGAGGQHLHAETGEARFATVQALVRKPETAADAYVAMVEENEIRVGLSQYERARVAALGAARGVFPDEEAALRALFGAASRPKRSRIRAFLEIWRVLDGILRFPAHLPERLGLRLVEALRAGQGPRIVAALEAADPATPEAELAVLGAALARPAAPPPAPVDLAPGVTLETRLSGRTLTLRLRGRGVTPELAAEVRARLDGLLP